jgi:AcrR family transcriptional regulator
LDVAEKLFAENGIQGTSIRKIINEAGVNVASVHYHFGSKKVLLKEIIVRRLLPINQEKLNRLEIIKTSATDSSLNIRDLIRAFVEPHFQLNEEERKKFKSMLKLIAQLEAELDKDYLDLPQHTFFSDVFNKYLMAFKNALPHLSLAELSWRFKFMLGAMHAIMMNPPTPGSSMENETEDMNIILNYIINFLEAGFLAPSTKTEG